VDAKVHGSIPTNLQFHASARGSLGSSSDAKASYLVGVYFYYNVAFGAVANVLGLKNWASGDRMAFDPAPRYTIFEKTDSFSGSTNFARSTIDNDKSGNGMRYPRRALFNALHIASPDQNEHDIVVTNDNFQNQSWSVPNDAILGKRADSDSDSDVAMPDFSAAQQLTCPPGDTSQVILPDFRCEQRSIPLIGHLLTSDTDNCNVFRPQVIQSRNGANSASLPGICEGIQRFFRRRGLANSALTMTWDPYKVRDDERREHSCPSNRDGGFCADVQGTLRRIAGNHNIEVQCDEFPYAGVEEGGEYFSTLDNNADYTETTCIPAWQNNLQGNCHSKISDVSKYCPNSANLLSRQNFLVRYRPMSLTSSENSAMTKPRSGRNGLLPPKPSKVTI
jgi:hypothetical protein